MQVVAETAHHFHADRRVVTQELEEILANLSSAYIDEQAFRYNNRGGKKKENRVTDNDRFRLLLSQIAGKRLTWAEVTGKVGETAF